MTNAQKRKRRGLILSPLGLQRLQDAQEQLAIAKNKGVAYTLEQLSDLTRISVRSLGRIRSGKEAVDRQTLEELFRAFNLTLTEQDYFQPEASANPSLPASAIALDWGEAPDASLFYGRVTELTTLSEWILRDRCRLVEVVGIGGIGKTALSVKLAEQVQNHFTYVIWRSLRNAPPLKTLLAELVPFLSEQQETQADVSSLLQCLQNSRCLVVLDNMETLLGTGNQVGQFREGYEAYGELLRVVAEARHQSCCVLTSREKCAQLAQWEGRGAVQRLSLTGSPEAAEALLEAAGLTRLDHSHQALRDAAKTLCEHYRCNPLALKIVATTIRDLFAGDISLFLEQNVTLFGDISDLIHQQYSRLSSLEKQVMLWLAVDREWVSFAQLRADLPEGVPPNQLMKALQLLEGRSLIETQSGQFTLQPVVMEYMTEALIANVCNQIVNGLSPDSLLQTHALIKAQDKDYIRESQIRVILTPLMARLIGELGSKKEVIYQLQQILLRLQTESPNAAGYAGGNIVNLLCHLRVDLRGYDFSHLSIWQADLQNVTLHQINLSHSDVSKSRFAQPFGSILAVAFSPDSQLMATGDSNNVVSLWQVSDGQSQAILRGHSAWVRAVAWSLDGQMFASGSEDHSVRLWNLETGIPFILQGHRGTVRTLAWQPNGNLLASGGDDNEIRLWNGSRKKLVKPLQGHSNWVMSVAWSLDGQILASASLDQTVRLWDVERGECLNILSGHDSGIWSLAWSPNGDYLATGSEDQSIKIWDVSSGECLKTLQGNHGAVFSVVWSPDSQLIASGGEDQNVRIWDIVSDRCLKNLQGHSNIIWAMAWSPNGAVLASGSHDQTVRLWDGYSTRSSDSRSLKTLQGHSNSVFAVVWSPDGRTLASSSTDHQIRLWNPDTGLCLNTLQGHSNWIWGLAWSPDGTTLASASDDTTVRLWSPSTGQCLKILQGHSAWAWAVDWHPNSQILASASGDLDIRLWDVQRGRCLKILQGHTNWIWALAWSPDGTTLASASDDCTVRLWNFSTGECINVLQGHNYWVQDIAWSPDGQILASSSYDIRLWDSHTGECLNILRDHSDMIRTIDWSPDGQMIASCSHDQTVRLWDSRTGECLKVLEGHTSQVWSVAWCSVALSTAEDRDFILASSSTDETIKLWNTRTGDCLKTLRANRPYEGMNITGITGITDAQKATLQALGAIASNEAAS